MHKRIGAAVAGTAAALLLVTACGSGSSSGYDQASNVAPAAQQQNAAQSAQPGASSSDGYGYDDPSAASPSASSDDGYGYGDDSSGSGDDAEAASDKKWPILSVVNDAKLADILVDFKGRTLYRFDKDTDWPMVSNCTGDCLKKWPPAKPVSKAEAEAAGLNPKLVSTYTRSDGTKQLSYNCWPVYWYTGDTKAGDTNGHGVGGTWWAMAANGKKANGGKPIN